MSTVTPLNAVTFADSSDSRELFWRSRSYASDILFPRVCARVGDGSSRDRRKAVVVQERSFAAVSGDGLVVWTSAVSFGSEALVVLSGILDSKKLSFFYGVYCV